MIPFNRFVKEKIFNVPSEPAWKSELEGRVIPTTEDKFIHVLAQYEELSIQLDDMVKKIARNRSCGLSLARDLYPRQYMHNKYCNIDQSAWLMDFRQGEPVKVAYSIPLIDTDSDENELTYPNSNKYMPVLIEQFKKYAAYNGFQYPDTSLNDTISLSSDHRVADKEGCVVYRKSVKYPDFMISFTIGGRAFQFDVNSKDRYILSK